MSYAAVLFDFDYTLGDATEGNLMCICSALSRMGLPLPSREAMIHTIGLSLPDTYRQLTGDGEESRAIRFAEWFTSTAEDVMVPNTTLYPGVLPLLHTLRQQGKKVGVVTTKFHYRIRQIFEACGEGFAFDCIVGREDVRRPKPHPEALQKAAGLLELPLEEILYLGDSRVDALAAQAAGMDFAAVLTGTTSRQQFQALPHRCILPAATSLLDSWPRL